MAILGVDYGEAKIGLAISEGELAQPVGVIDINNWREEIARICQAQGVGKIILGVSEGQEAKKTREFGEELKNLTGLPVEYFDETLTSKVAVEKLNEAGKPRMKKKSSEHGFAAAIILQDYLDSQKDSFN